MNKNGGIFPTLKSKLQKLQKLQYKARAKFPNSCDPFAAAVEVDGKTRASASLSWFSANQCAGLVQVIAPSFAPSGYNY